MSKPLIQTTGRRKEAIARVRLRPGTGKIVINGREIESYFHIATHRTVRDRGAADHPDRRRVRRRRHDLRRRHRRPVRRPRRSASPGRWSRSTPKRDPRSRRPGCSPATLARRSGASTASRRRARRRSTPSGSSGAAHGAALRHRRDPRRRGHRAHGRVWCARWARPRSTRSATDVPFLVARDTRESGPELEAALVDGHDRAPVPTSRASGCSRPRAWPPPARDTGAAGAMISASHNPFSDNGVKLFEPGGRKLRDGTEAAVEAALEATARRSRSDARVRGRRRLTTRDGRRRPLRRPPRRGARRRPAARRSARRGRRGQRCSRRGGPACATARSARRSTSSGATPDGRNINAGLWFDPSRRSSPRRCVAPARDVGLAFDGDADRVVAVDASGADRRRRPPPRDPGPRPRRPGPAPRTARSRRRSWPTSGLTRALAPHGIDVVVTPVGDRHVLAAMEEHDLVLGGEQSGSRDHRGPLRDRRRPSDRSAAARRDGRGPGRPLADLAAVVTKLPQVLENVRVARPGRPGGVPPASGPRCGGPRPIWVADGRVLVRPSGTEPVVRVMVEARRRRRPRTGSTAVSSSALTEALGSG